MVGHTIQSVSPNVPRLELPTLYPQYLSKVRRDFRVWERIVCLAQQLL